MIQAQSYGGGVQSVALAILNATGRVDNPAKLAIFADPGSEEAGTYAHMEVMRPWLAERGTEVVTVAVKTALYEYVVERSTVLPVRSMEAGLGRRQCTREWKVDPINRELRRRGSKAAVVQLGISLAEIHRMKDSPAKWIQHRFPLIELRLTRQDCRRIINEAGLPEPPKSRCIFCPLQAVGSWQRLASYQPDVFERAARLEDVIIARQEAKGKPPLYLSSRLKPLREAFDIRQRGLFQDGDGQEDELCGGYCFT